MTDTETGDWVLVPRDMPKDYLDFYEGVLMDEGMKGPGAAKKAWAALLKLVAATKPLSASPKGDDLEPVAFDATNRADQIAMGIATLDGEKWVRLCDYEAALQSIKAENATLKREIAELREALTPSGDTKAAYIGEFAFTVDFTNEDGEDTYMRVDVPWTTVKEIMAAILDRATQGAAALEAKP